MFNRLHTTRLVVNQENEGVIMLTTQYRMTSSICEWPTRYFYGGKIITAESLIRNGPYEYRWTRRCWRQVPLAGVCLLVWCLSVSLTTEPKQNESSLIKGGWWGRPPGRKNRPPIHSPNPPTPQIDPLPVHPPPKKNLHLPTHSPQKIDPFPQSKLQKRKKRTLTHFQKTNVKSLGRTVGLMWFLSTKQLPRESLILKVFLSRSLVLKCIRLI
jgi:hypothetical protein